MDQLDIARFAGLFDGEGCISLRRVNGRGPYVQLNLTMIDEDIIRWIHATTECGSIRPMVMRPSGRKGWTWIACHKRDVARLLLAIYPVVGQRRQAKIAEAAECLAQTQTIKRRKGKSRCTATSGS